MADNTVKLEIFANAQAAEKAIVGLEKKYDDLQNKIRQAAKASKKSSDDAKTAFDGQAVAVRGVEGSLLSLVGRVGAATTVIGLLGAAIKGATDKNREWSRSTDETVRRLDEARLKLAIQGGFDQRGLAGVEPRIRKALLETPSTDAAGAFEIMTQIASSGFKQADIDSGEALKSILDINAATTMFGRGVVSPKDSTLAISQFLKGTGVVQPDAKQIRDLGGKIAQLFNKSDLQFPFLKELAGESAALTSFGITPEEQLAAFATLSDVKSAPEAATGLRAMATDLATAGASKDKTAALRKLGLKPADVDLVGENLTTALQRLQGGLGNVDPTKQNQLLVRLFGERTLSSATTLMGQMDKFRMLRGAMEGNEFEKALGTFQTSRVASRNRTALISEFAQSDIAEAEGGLSWQDVRDRQKAAFGRRRIGASAGGKLALALTEYVSEKVGGALEGFGQSPVDAGFSAELIKATREQTEVLKRIEAKAGNNRAGQRE